MEMNIFPRHVFISCSQILPRQDFPPPGLSLRDTQSSSRFPAEIDAFSLFSQALSLQPFLPSRGSCHLSPPSFFLPLSPLSLLVFFLLLPFLFPQSLFVFPPPSLRPVILLFFSFHLQCCLILVYTPLSSVHPPHPFSFFFSFSPLLRLPFSLSLFLFPDDSPQPLMRPTFHYGDDKASGRHSSRGAARDTLFQRERHAQALLPRAVCALPFGANVMLVPVGSISSFSL